MKASTDEIVYVLSSFAYVKPEVKQSNQTIFIPFHLLSDRLISCMAITSAECFGGEKHGVIPLVVIAHRLGFDSGLAAIYGLSWLLILYSAARGFSPSSPVFSSPPKSTFPDSNSIECRTSLKTTFALVEFPR